MCLLYALLLVLCIIVLLLLLDWWLGMCLNSHGDELKFEVNSKFKLGIDANSGTVLFFHIILSLYMF